MKEQLHSLLIEYHIDPIIYKWAGKEEKFKLICQMLRGEKITKILFANLLFIRCAARKGTSQFRDEGSWGLWKMRFSWESFWKVLDNDDGLDDKFAIYKNFAKLGRHISKKIYETIEECLEFVKSGGLGSADLDCFEEEIKNFDLFFSVLCEERAKLFPESHNKKRQVFLNQASKNVLLNILPKTKEHFEEIVFPQFHKKYLEEIIFDEIEQERTREVSRIFNRVKCGNELIEAEQRIIKRAKEEMKSLLENISVIDIQKKETSTNQGNEKLLDEIKILKEKNLVNEKKLSLFEEKATKRENEIIDNHWKEKMTWGNQICEMEKRWKKRMFDRDDEVKEEKISLLRVYITNLAEMEEKLTLSQTRLEKYHKKFHNHKKSNHLQYQLRETIKQLLEQQIGENNRLKNRQAFLINKAVELSGKHLRVDREMREYENISAELYNEISKEKIISQSYRAYKEQRDEIRRQNQQDHVTFRDNVRHQKEKINSLTGQNNELQRTISDLQVQIKNHTCSGCHIPTHVDYDQIKQKNIDLIQTLENLTISLDQEKNQAKKLKAEKEDWQQREQELLAEIERLKNPPRSENQESISIETEKYQTEIKVLAEKLPAEQIKIINSVWQEAENKHNQQLTQLQNQLTVERERERESKNSFEFSFQF